MAPVTLLRMRLVPRAVLAALVAMSFVIAALAAGRPAANAESGLAGVVPLTAEAPPVAAGETSGWIRVLPGSIVIGALTVRAPTGTTIVAADADTRPLAGAIAPDGSSVTWGGRTTWAETWRTAKFRLRADPGGVPARGSGAMEVRQHDGTAVLASGAFTLDRTVGFAVSNPTLHAGATSSWVPLRPVAAVHGILSVTAPTGTRIVGADTEGHPLAATIAPDGRAATWHDAADWAVGLRVPRIRLHAEETIDGPRESGAVTVRDRPESDRVVASAFFESVDPGPRPASIVPSTDGTSTTVLVHGLGSAITAQQHEGRNMRHSDLQPTGRFVRRGDVVEVTVPAGAPEIAFRVGVVGQHDGIDATGISSARRTPTGTTRFTADRDGVVFAQSTSATGSARVRVSGGEVVPTFVLGQTSNTQFAQQLRDRPDAPVFELVGGRVFADFQRRVRDAVPDDVQRLVQTWDDVVTITNGMHDLHDDAVGRSSKAPHRLYIASPDSGVGYASATDERITFQVDSGAARDLLGGPATDQWAFWHEVGHTYEPHVYTWSGQTEVAVNVSSIEVANRLGVPNRLDGQQAGVASFFAQPVGDRRYAAADQWTRLLMYEQLRRAFGDEFYPRFHRDVRVALGLGEAGIATSQDRIDLFARTAARLAERDLTPFFREWGLAVGPDVRDEMAELPPLRERIWENRVAAQTAVERVIPAVGLPTGRIGTQPSVVVGQRSPSAPLVVDGLGSTDGRPVSVGRTVLDAKSPSVGGTVLAELRHAGGGRELVEGTVPVTAGNAVQLIGEANRPVLWIALLDGGELRVVANTTYAAHSQWSGREYLGFELRSADDSTSLGAASLRGEENAHRLAASFRGQWEDGQLLVVRHAQTNGIHPFVDDEPVQTSRALEQRFRIVDGTLVRDDGAVTPVRIDSPADGADVPLRPEVRGHGEPGALVELSVKGTGVVIASTTVDRAGEWSATSRVALDGTTTLVATQYAYGPDSTH